MPMLAIPRARSSASASISSPGAANARAVSTLSVNATTAMPAAGPRSVRKRVQIRRDAQGGEALGDRPDDLDAELLEVEPRRGQGRAQDGDQGPRHPWPSARPDEQHDDHRQPDRGGGAVGVAQLADGRPDLGQRRAAGDGDAEQLAQLAGDHDDRDTGEVADQHRLAQQGGDDPQSQDAAQQAHHPDEQRRERGHGGVRGGITSGQRGQRGGRHDGRRRLRAHREQPRRACKRVDGQGEQAGPEADHRVEAGQCRVGHHLRDEVGGHAESGKAVRTQAGPIEPAHPLQVVRRRSAVHPHAPQCAAPDRSDAALRWATCWDSVVGVGTLRNTMPRCRRRPRRWWWARNRTRRPS